MRIKAEDAIKQTTANPAAKWPERGAQSRLSPLCAPAVAPGFKLIANEPVFTIGSCFARNVEFFLQKKGFPVPASDFDVPQEELWTGTTGRSGMLNKYTPHSMLNEIIFATSNTDGSEFLIENSDGLYMDAQLHTNVPVTLERGLERRQQLKTLYRNALTDCRVIVVTLGLIEAWWDEKSQTYLNETPNTKMLRQNPGRFTFEVLSPDNATKAVLDLLRLMNQHGRDGQRVVLSVSPVPIQRTFTTQDVITANTYSKAVLRVAAQQAVEQCDWVEYYPSFEAVTLSDPNTSWENDGIHVRQVEIHRNVERMLALYS